MVLELFSKFCVPRSLIKLNNKTVKQYLIMPLMFKIFKNKMAATFLQTLVKYVIFGIE